MGEIGQVPLTTQIVSCLLLIERNDTSKGQMPDFIRKLICTIKINVHLTDVLVFKLIMIILNFSIALPIYKIPLQRATRHLERGQ